MVAFSDSRTDPILLNGIEITVSNNSNSNHNDNLTDDTRRVKDQAFTLSRVTMSSCKDNYALKFDNIEKIDDRKLNTNNNINAEPVVMQKIAGKKYIYIYIYKL